MVAIALLAGCSHPTLQDEFGTLNTALGIAAVDDLSVVQQSTAPDVTDILGKRRVARFLDSLEWRPKKSGEIAPVPEDWTVMLFDHGKKCGTIRVYGWNNIWRFYCPEAQYIADSSEWQQFMNTLASSDRDWQRQLGIDPSRPNMPQAPGNSAPNSTSKTTAGSFAVSPSAIGIGLGVLTFFLAGWLTVNQFANRDKTWKWSALLALLGIAVAVVSGWRDEHSAAEAKTLKQSIAVAKRKANEIEAQRIADITGIITLAQTESLAEALKKIQSQANGQLQATVIAPKEYEASWRYARTLAEIMADAKFSPPQPAEIVPIADDGITIFATEATPLIQQLADAISLTARKPSIFTAGIPNYELENSKFKLIEELFESNRKAAPEKTHVLIVIGYIRP